MQKSSFKLIILFFNILASQSSMAQEYLPFLTSEGKYVFVNRETKTLQTYSSKYSTIIDLHSGFYSYCDNLGQNSRYGLIFNGREITSNKFQLISESSEGVVLAIGERELIYTIDDKGLVTNTNLKMDLNYAKRNIGLFKFYSGIALLRGKADSLTAINKSGNIIFKLANVHDFSPFNGKYAAVKFNNEKGYCLINRLGIKVTASEFNNILYLNKNLFAFEKNSKLGFINSNEDVVKYGEYEQIELLANNRFHSDTRITIAMIENPVNLIRIKRNGRYGYLNTDLKEIITPIYKDATIFNLGTATVKFEDDKIGIVDTAGICIGKAFFGKDALPIVKNSVLAFNEKNKAEIFRINRSAQPSYPYTIPNVSNYSFMALSLHLPFDRFICLPSMLDTAFQGFWLENVVYYIGGPLNSEGGGAAAFDLSLMLNHQISYYETSEYANRVKPGSGMFENVYDYYEFDKRGLQKVISLPFRKWFFVSNKGEQYRDSTLFFSPDISRNLNFNKSSEIKSKNEPPPPPPSLGQFNQQNSIKYRQLLDSLNIICNTENLDSIGNTLRIINGKPDTKICKTIITKLKNQLLNISNFSGRHLSPEYKTDVLGINFPSDVFKSSEIIWPGLLDISHRYLHIITIYNDAIIEAKKNLEIKLKKMYPEYIMR